MYHLELHHGFLVFHTVPYRLGCKLNDLQCVLQPAVQDSLWSLRTVKPLFGGDEQETNQSLDHSISFSHNFKDEDRDRSVATQGQPSIDSPPWLQLGGVERDDVDYDVKWLEYKMLGLGFSLPDIREIVAALHCVMAADDSKVFCSTYGVVDFCRLLLETEAEELLTKQVLLAAILHYVECVEARQMGLQSRIEDALRHQKPYTFSPSSSQPFGPQSTVVPHTFFAPATTDDSNSLNDRTNRGCINDPSAALIAKAAARIKRAELLAQVVLQSQGQVSHEWTRDLGSQVRGLLLSVMDDWRALAIRCVASLYRLDGILRCLEHSEEPYERTSLMIRTAKEGMYIYATLAQRLGMNRLKARIEERAFQILFRRQYQAVTSIYRKNGDAMQKLSSYLLHSISQVLQHDDALMLQLEDISVTARVKEPYSFWRKLLKTRLRPKQAISGTPGATLSLNAGNGFIPGDCAVVSSSRNTSLSVADVQDGIALRVVLKACKWSEDELDDITRSRERLLCYYVQNLIRNRWPELDSDRIKDYIKSPKPNGYQSLHHTSAVSANGTGFFPFEVQIRSEDMHRSAEYGVAAHWDYKLGSTKANSSSSIVPAKYTPDDLNETIMSTWFLQGDTLEILEDADPSSESPTQSQTSSSGSYLDALVTAKKSLLKETLYVFMSGHANTSPSDQGSIISLPPHSTVGDALIAVNFTSSLWGNSLSSCTVWKNGIVAELNDNVDNGDVIVVKKASLIPATGSVTPHN